MKTVNFWPIGIAMFLISFVILVVAAGFFISREKYDLVRQDYYAHEIAYEDHIDGIRRTQSMAHKPTFQVFKKDSTLAIQFPPDLAGKVDTPLLHLYYPADKHQDLHLALELDAQGQQRIQLPETASGNWKAGLQWTINEELYILEQRISL